MTDARVERVEPDPWAACDAVLAIHGRQVVGTEKGHQLRLAEAADVLPGHHEPLFQRLDEGRMTRNAVSYRAGFVPEADISEALTAVAELVRIATAHVEPRLPDWAAEGGP